MFQKLFKSAWTSVVVGFLLTTPIVATILIFRFLFNLTTDWMPRKLIEKLPKIMQGFPAQLLTLLVVLVFCYVVGLLVRNYFGRRLYQFGDKILASIPFIKGIYISVRQISQSLFTQRKTLFKEVVLVEYPRKGLFSLAFVTSRVPPALAGKIVANPRTQPCITLFIPTTPNPTSGLIILVERSHVIPINIPVADALTYIMSAGAVGPGDSTELSPTFLDRIARTRSPGR